VNAALVAAESAERPVC